MKAGHDFFSFNRIKNISFLTKTILALWKLKIYVHPIEVGIDYFPQMYYQYSYFTECTTLALIMPQKLANFQNLPDDSCNFKVILNILRTQIVYGFRCHVVYLGKVAAVKT